jgi:hypothetical protein
MEGNQVGVVGDSAKLIGETKAAIEKTPKGKEAVILGGESAEIVMHTVRNVLLPLAAFNFAVDKAKRYFEGKFGRDLATKLEGVPPEDIIEPKASIVGPAIQGLAYSFEEDELREMYLNLLKTSMDGRKPNGAHPAFVEIIKQLSAREAELLKLMWTRGTAHEPFPISQMRAVSRDPEATFNILHNHIMDVDVVFGDLLIDISEMTQAVENWTRLGLVTVDYTSFLADDSSYAFEETFPRLNELRANWGDVGYDITFTHGVLRSTRLGDSFSIAAIG